MERRCNQCEYFGLPGWFDPCRACIKETANGRWSRFEPRKEPKKKKRKEEKKK